MAAAKTSSPKTAPHWRPDLIGGDQPAAALVAACNELKFEAKGGCSGRPTFKKSSSRSTWHPLGVPGLTANVGTVIVRVRTGVFYGRLPRALGRVPSSDAGRWRGS